MKRHTRKATWNRFRGWVHILREREQGGRRRGLKRLKRLKQMNTDWGNKLVVWERDIAINDISQKK